MKNSIKTEIANKIAGTKENHLEIRGNYWQIFKFLKSLKRINAQLNDQGKRENTKINEEPNIKRNEKEIKIKKMLAEIRLASLRNVYRVHPLQIDCSKHSSAI